MGITNENVSQSFVATAGQTVFPFSLTFFTTPTIIIKQNGVTLTAPQYSIGTFIGSNPYTGATLTLTSGATLNDTVVVSRDVAFTMDQFLALNDSFAAKATAIQTALDKLTMMSQEVKAIADEAYSLISVNDPYPLPTPSSLKALRWNVGGTAVENFEAALQSDLSDVESDVSTLQTVDSLLDVRLVDCEDRLDQIVADLLPINSAVSDLITDVSTLQSDKIISDAYIADLRLRVIALESFMGTEGNIAILNNQIAPIVIPDFTTDGNDFTSVRIDYEIMRRTGTEYRSSVGELYMVYRDNGVWATDRGVSVIDLDGITFSIDTLPNDIGQISYTSDEVLGAGYNGYIKYRLIKFAK